MVEQQVTGWRLGLMLLAACSTAYSVFAAVSSVLITLPVMGQDLEASQSDVQWIADAFPLALATLLLPAGLLADRFGRRRMLLLGLPVMVAGQLLAGSADSPDLVIAGMFVGGLGAGIAFPSTLSTVTVTTPPERRSWAIGIWATSVPLGGLFGIVSAGIVLELTSWRGVFLALAITSAVAWVLALLGLPETRDPNPTPPDLIGSLFSAVAVAGLVLGLTHGPVDGWTDPTTMFALVISAVAGFAFVWWELRSEHPMVDVRLFKIPSFGTAAVAIFAVFASLYGVSFLYFQYETFVLGYSPLKSAFGMSPAGLLTMGPLALVGAVLAKRVGTRPVVIASLASGVVGTGLLSVVAGGEKYLPVAVGLVIWGACVGLGAGPVTEAITSQIPANKQGVAAAVNNLSRELGAVLGIAMFGTAFNMGYRHDIEQHLDPATDPIAAAAKQSPAAGTQAASLAGADAGPYLDSIASATSTGFSVGMAAIAVVTLLVLIFVAIRFPAGIGKAGSSEMAVIETTPTGGRQVLAGTITSTTGFPLTRVNVTVVDLAGRHIACARTDQDGRYRIDARPGGYLVVCSASGLAPRAARVTIDGTALDHDVAMSPAAL